MSYNLNSFIKRGYIGYDIGVMKGDARSSDYSSHWTHPVRIPSAKFGWDTPTRPVDQDENNNLESYCTNNNNNKYTNHNKHNNNITR